MNIKNLTCTLLAFVGMALIAEGPLEISDDGAIKVDELSLKIVFRDAKWSQETVTAQNFTPEPGFPERQPDAFRLQGRFRLQEGGEFRLEQTMARSGDSWNGDWKLTSPQPVHANLLCLSLELPASQYGGERLQFGKQNIELPKQFSAKDVIRFFSDAEQLRIPLQSGELRISGRSKLFLQIQDNRKWGVNTFSVNFMFSRPNGELTQSGLFLKIAFSPHSSTPISLVPAANMEFRDDVPADGKGGWTDQGPDNDLRDIPPGEQTFCGIRFLIAAPAANGEKTCIVLRGEQRPAFPGDAILPVSGRAKYLYLLHGVAWPKAPGTPVGSILCHYADGTEHEQEIVGGRDVDNFWNPKPLANALPGWTGRNQNTRIGLFVTPLPLEDKELERLTFRSAGNAVWMIVGASLANHRINIQAGQPATFRAGKEWTELHAPPEVKKGSILDFSFLLDAPAGKYGFAQCPPGSGFEFSGRPGIRQRFYGANICFEACFLPKADADKLADEIARQGYNLVRLHHFDWALPKNPGRDSLTITPEILDRLEYTIAAFRERGIYLTLDLFSTRRIPGENVGLPQQNQVPSTEFKTQILFNPQAMDNVKQYAKLLLTHVNPYTGLALKDDPALLYLDFVNEDTPEFLMKNSPVARSRFEQEFEAWLGKQNTAITSENRIPLWRDFLHETYQNKFRELEAFVRKLGVRAPITALNVDSRPGLTVQRSVLDVVDVHTYQGHPNRFQLLPFEFETMSAVLDNGGCIANIFQDRIFGKPFSVSEWGFPNPSAYNAEGPFLAGAYAALQDWDALIQFQYTGGDKRQESKEYVQDFFDLSRDPVRQLADRAGVLFFLRGDVAAAQKAFPYLISDEKEDLGMLQDAYPTTLRQIGLIGRTGSLFWQKGTPLRLPAGTLAVLGSGPAPADAKKWTVPYVDVSVATSAFATMQLKGLITSAEHPNQMEFSSSTGELALDMERETFGAITPRSEGAVLPPGKSFHGRFMNVEKNSAFSGFLAAAMDGNPLSQSMRILLIHATQCRNTGLTIRADGKTYDSWGTLPLLMRRGTAHVTFTRDLSGFTLYALDFDGVRLFQVPLTENGFEADNSPGQKAVAAYELAKE